MVARNELWKRWSDMGPHRSTDSEGSGALYAREWQPAVLQTWQKKGGEVESRNESTKQAASKAL
jgi:hypothetical protein